MEGLNGREHLWLPNRDPFAAERTTLQTLIKSGTPISHHTPWITEKLS
jgi:hypothetical protein